MQNAAADITCWVRLQGKFINETNIRAIKRDGSNTRITFIHGEDMVVALTYDKVKALFPKVK